MLSRKKIKEYIRSEWLLLGILILAFLLRVVGVGYGLPLTVVNDEYPFTYAALQMIQAHTLVPALHPELFQNILPYPPYISYVLIPPFVAILGVMYVLWQGSAAVFQAHLLADLSAFFIIARLINVILGVFSVYLVYRIGASWLRSRVAALTAAFLLATSILHSALSMVGRNWVPTSLIFLLILFILTREEWTPTRRYTWGFVIAGIGIGITSLSAASIAMMALYYLCFDARTVRSTLSDVCRMTPGAMMFCVLAAVPFLLWHSGGAVFATAVTLGAEKSLIGLLVSPWVAMKLFMFSEPVLAGLFIAGLVTLAVHRMRMATFIVSWSLVYVGIFYTVYWLDARFLLPVFPLLALVGGYFVAQIWNRRTAVLVCIVLSVPLISAVRLSSLAAQGDTRAYAREWILEKLKPSDKVLVFSSWMHVPTQAAAVDDLRELDANAIRKADESDVVLDRHDVPYTLNNITSITSTSTISKFQDYVRAHGYSYVIIEPRSLVGLHDMAGALSDITKGAIVVQKFSGLGDQMSLYNSVFSRPLSELFSGRTLGPDIEIYRLPTK